MPANDVLVAPVQGGGGGGVGMGGASSGLAVTVAPAPAVVVGTVGFAGGGRLGRFGLVVGFATEEGGAGDATVGDGGVCARVTEANKVVARASAGAANLTREEREPMTGAMYHALP